MMGSFATKAKDAVDRLRSVGRKVGLLQPRLLRPFPVKAIVRALAGKKGIAVIDQNISLGKGGILYTELCSALYSMADKPVIVSFIGGLGGRDITREEFYEMVAVTMKAIETGEAPPPRLLYSKEELIQMKGLQSIARVEQRKGRGKR
jgi:pyruvate ferredoxin oxidoreductase alpha subunit